MSNKSRNLYPFFLLLAISLIVQFFATKSSPFYLFNDWVDPNAYMSISRGWLSGLVPYRDLFDHKGPMLYMIYIIGCLITDTSFTGIYIIQSIFFAITLFFIFKISHLFISLRLAILVPILFIPIFCSLNLNGGSAEEFMQAFQSIFLYLVLRIFTNTAKNKEFKFLFFAGAIVGMLIFIKFNIIAFCFCFLAAIILNKVINKNIKSALISTMYIVLGILSTTMPFIIYFYLTDSLNNFFEAYITFNKIYGSVSFDNIITNLPEVGIKYIFTNLFIIIGVLYLSISNKYFNNSIYKASFSFTIILTYISLYCTWYIIPYNYFPLSILSIFFFISIFFLLENTKFKYHYKLLVMICISSTIISSFWIKRTIINNRNEYSCIKDFSDYIISNSTNNGINKKDLRILQVSLDNGLLFLTQSTPYYKYFYHPNINDIAYPYIYQAYSEYINSNKPPHYIYYVKEVKITPIASSQITKDFEQLLTSKYTLVKEYADYSIWPTNNKYLFELKK